MPVHSTLQVHRFAALQVACTTRQDIGCRTFCTVVTIPHAGPSLPSPPAATQAAPPPPADVPSLPPPEDLLGTARRLLRASAALPTSSAPAGSERAGPQAGHQSKHATGPVRHGGTALALVVDHGLRPASGAEAAATAELVRGWGLQPVLLRAEWPGGRPVHGAMMAGARAARQRLFREACQRHGVGNLLVAHQAGEGELHLCGDRVCLTVGMSIVTAGCTPRWYINDDTSYACDCRTSLLSFQAGDQAETFLMRLSRASGVNGLAGMALASMLTVVDSTASSLHTLGGGGRGGVGSDDGRSDSGRGAGRDAAGAGSNAGIRLLRPLLGVHRAELRQLLRSCGVPWIDDPTNEDRSYARNAIRAMLAAPPNRSEPSNGVPETAGPIGSEGSAAQHASAAAAALTPPPVVSDMLRLQGRCAAAQREMQRSAGQLLRACIPERQPAGATPNTWQLALAPLAAAPKPAVMRALAAVLQV